MIKPQISQSLILNHVTTVLTNQNARNFKYRKILGEIMQLNTEVFPFKE